MEVSPNFSHRLSVAVTTNTCPTVHQVTPKPTPTVTLSIENTLSLSAVSTTTLSSPASVLMTRNSTEFEPAISSEPKLLLSPDNDTIAITATTVVLVFTLAVLAAIIIGCLVCYFCVLKKRRGSTCCSNMDKNQTGIRKKNDGLPNADFEQPKNDTTTAECRITTETVPVVVGMQKQCHGEHDSDQGDEEGLLNTATLTGVGPVTHEPVYDNFIFINVDT